MVGLTIVLVPSSQPAKIEHTWLKCLLVAIEIEAYQTKSYTHFTYAFNKRVSLSLHI